MSPEIQSKMQNMLAKADADLKEQHIVPCHEA